MNDKQQSEHHEAFNVGDIYFVLFRQKWIILTFFALGLLAAGTLFIIKPALYESSTVLYLQYVIDADPGNQPNQGMQTRTLGTSTSIILNEEEFLSSADLANEVVSNVGAARILAKAGGGASPDLAAAFVLRHLVPETSPATPNILRISFQHPDKDMAREILERIVQAYIKRSAFLHQPANISPDEQRSKIAELQKSLEGTESQLRNVDQQAGVLISLEETRKGKQAQLGQLQENLVKAETDLAKHQTISEMMPTNSATNSAVANVAQPIPEDILTEYKTEVELLEDARKQDREQRAKLAPENPDLIAYHDLVVKREKEKKALEVLYPGLAESFSAVPTEPNTKGSPDLIGPLLVPSLKNVTNYLHGQINSINADLAKLDAAEPRIQELVRQRDQLKKDYENAQDKLASQEKWLATDPNGGIKISQSPTPASKKFSKVFKKLLGMALGGGLAGGLGLAFLIEKILDRRIRRPSEIENKLHLPLFISIPDISPNGHGHSTLAAAPNRRLLKDKEGNGESMVPAVADGASPKGNGELAPWDHDNALHKFYAGLRDRLIVNFEVRNLTHNPKLVAVTSCNRGAGVSSIAAGLAASLSETGDGNVLLVNMNGEEGGAQHFHQGRPGCGIDAALESETRSNAYVSDNLYFADESGGVDGAGNLPRILPKRFAGLMPKLKASDFDYIIFDMPSVSQTSVTPRLAGLMDMVLLVIESEKTNRDAVQRATRLLTESQANVSTVLNKVKTYVPESLHQEYLTDS